MYLNRDYLYKHILLSDTGSSYVSLRNYFISSVEYRDAHYSIMHRCASGYDLSFLISVAVGKYKLKARSALYIVAIYNELLPWLVGLRVYYARLAATVDLINISTPGEISVAWGYKKGPFACH